ncbi:MAG: SDR family oxidoreductase [Rubrivivax sp.]|nr:SDR family oxidoreductase [Rubrivivax sp.]
MDLALSGRHVLVTGGSKGIGYACALAFCREGARVSLVARGQPGLDEAVARLVGLGYSARSFCADLGQAQAAHDMVEGVYRDVGAVDVLVNCAGAAARTPFDELSPQAWQAAMQAKFFAYIHVLDPVIKRMGAAGRGAIVNVVGAGGKLASPTHLAGGAANAALMLASAGLAAAYGPRGVRVNVVNPGLTLTDRLARGLLAEARLQQTSQEEVLAQHQRRLPLGRLAEPHEIADAVVFLASDRASYITGATLALDGALTPTVI